VRDAADPSRGRRRSVGVAIHFAVPERRSFRHMSHLTAVLHAVGVSHSAESTPPLATTACHVASAQSTATLRIVAGHVACVGGCE
jgi:hypothetical protein